jgi:hypothetical protein
MTLPYGIRAVHPSAASSRPFIVAFTTARTAANDTLLEAWNASTNAGRRFAVDLDGKVYSAALTAGDIVYAVAGGVTGVRRLDSLAIGAQHTVLRSSGTAPAWGALDLGEAVAVTGTLPFARLPEIAQNQVYGRTGAGTGVIAAIATSALTGLSAAGITAGNLAYARLPAGTGSWDVGLGEILTLTRDVEVGGDLDVTGDMGLLGDLGVTGTVTLVTPLAHDQLGTASPRQVLGRVAAGVGALSAIGFDDVTAVATSEETGTTYTLAADDIETLVRLTNANAIALTVPTNVAVPIAVGRSVLIQQGGAGQVTVAGAGSVAVNGTGDKLRDRWSAAVLLKVDTDEWTLMGDLEAPPPTTTTTTTVAPTTTTTTVAPTTTTTTV